MATCAASSLPLTAQVDPPVPALEEQRVPPLVQEIVGGRAAPVNGACVERPVDCLLGARRGVETRPDA
ncbi:MAG: hypothetical protein ABR567_18945 [Myxococcales bacterium]